MAAEIAAGFTLDEDLDKAPMVMAQLAGYLKARDRDLTSFGIAGRIQIDASDLEGSARKAAEWKALGATHLSAITMNAGLGDPRDHVRLALDFMGSWKGLHSSGN